MEQTRKSPRNGCGLHGALQTVSEIRGLVPIVHANAGCAMQNYLANKASGFRNLSVSGEAVFSTDVQERHVIFGGASRLREQIKNTIKVVGGELYIVLNSCESAMVGDDVDAMTREAAEAGEPVVDCLTAGFHGDSHYGYSTVLTSIIKQLGEGEEKEANLVNVFGILPQKDLRYKGDLYAVRDILEAAGLKVNLFFGVPDGVQQLQKSTGAALSLVFSKWGKEPAEELKRRYGVPVLELSTLPSGPEAVEELEGKLADALGDVVDHTSFETYLLRQREQFDYYFQSLIEDYYEENAARSVAIVGDESTILQVGGFLHTYFGVTVETAVVTDYFGKEELKSEEKSKWVTELAQEVFFTQDGKEIQDILRHSSAELILGSSLEDETAKRLGTVNLKISYPVYEKTILQETYTGVAGGVALAGDYISAVKKLNKKQESILKEKLA